MVLLFSGVLEWPLVSFLSSSFRLKVLDLDESFLLMVYDSFPMGTSVRNFLFLGDGDLEAEIHDFLAKLDRDPVTERRFVSRSSVSFRLPFLDSRVRSPVSPRGPNANFETAILGLIKERLDFL